MRLRAMVAMLAAVVKKKARTKVVALVVVVAVKAMSLMAVVALVMGKAADSAGAGAQLAVFRSDEEDAALSCVAAAFKSSLASCSDARGGTSSSSDAA